MKTADNCNYDSFNVPLSATERKPDHPPPLRSHSSETINYNFSPSDWEGKFTGNGNSGYPIPPRKQPSSTKARTSPTKHQVPLPPRVHQPSGSKGVESPNAIQKPTIQADQSVPVSRQEDYSPEKWESCFKPGALNFPPPPPPFGSPRAMSRKRSKAPKGPTRSVYKRPTVPKSATVSATADDAADSTSSNLDSASSKTSGDDSAMDIDSLPTPPSGEKPSGGDEQRPATQETPKAAPRPPVPPRPSTQPHDSSVEKPHLSMGDFKNVAPFAPSQEGIRDLNDLANALPFESRPSARAAKPPLPQQLELPPVPKAPAIPENLTQNSWERYIAQMRAYMYEWNAYNTKMLAHFNERQASVDAALQPDWMTAIGEGTDKWGYAKYMQGIEEDFRVRGYWDVSWEKHRECIRGLGAVRERLLGTSIKTSV
ncbi:MAG: hypothetical protein LQ342_006256 [Letrouitia transgressa]|nr:MAG: hypothetical protein LQ342_006256 [Letrouitia transgressa]